VPPPGTFADDSLGINTMASASNKSNFFTAFLRPFTTPLVPRDDKSADSFIAPPYFVTVIRNR
jgi:hypothetical protein